MYGPTETTVWSAVTKLSGQGAGYAPINGPLVNTRLYVVDEHRNLLPPGAIGELCIAGKGLSQGYWREYEKTAEVFVRDPFSGKSDELMYLTGDLVRQSASGELTFISRKDAQCKLHGHRIELGEIEFRLQQCEGIDSAAVQIVGSKNEENYLCAFFVGDETLDIKRYKTALAEYLPAYMVPTRFILVDFLPQTPNGKLDRKALATQVNRREPVVAQKIIVSAGNELERTMVDLWQELTGAVQISTQDNFFEIGGHSLMLLRLQGLIKKTLQKDVEVVDLLQYPTVSSLCQHLSQDGEVLMNQLKQSNQSRANKKKAAMKRNRVRKQEH